MTPLEELFVKWHDRSLSAQEQRELNGWLATAEGRARLRDEFGFQARLVVAVQVEKARAHAHDQAKAFQTIEVSHHDVFEKSRSQPWRVFRLCVPPHAQHQEPCRPSSKAAGCSTPASSRHRPGDPSRSTRAMGSNQDRA